jgi:hypothetical protein
VVVVVVDTVRTERSLPDKGIHKAEEEGSRIVEDLETLTFDTE